MHYALPHPQRTLAVPLAALALGLAGGVSGALILTDDTVEFRTAAPSAEVSAPKSSAVPVPERVAPTPVAPVASSSSPAPVPERVTPAPSSQATANVRSTAPVPERVTPAPTSQASGNAGSTAPVPERISGQRVR